MQHPNEPTARRTAAGGPPPAATAEASPGVELPPVQDQIEVLRERATELDRQARAFIRKNPTTAVLGAIAVGFIVGRIVTR